MVDPLSSGSQLAQRLTDRGYRVIAVHSSPKIIDALIGSYRAKSVIGDIFPLGQINVREIERIAKQLEAYRYPNVSIEDSIRAVFVGSENGTVLGDGLSHLLGLPGNAPRLSLTKRDKAVMHERLALLGVDHIAHLRSSSIDKILEWIKGPNAGKYPVVIKPLDSAATQGVSICENEAEVRAAFHDLMTNSKTVFGRPIDEVLVQEFLEGIEDDSEYVVNTASSGGRHIVTDIVRYHKKRIRKPNGSSAIIYLFDEFVPLNSPIARMLREYALRVLDATGVAYGPAHMEVMNTPRGPVLVEIGARPAGSGMPVVASHAYNHHPLDLIIDAYLRPERFLDIWRGETRNPGIFQTMYKQARQVALISQDSGYVISTSGLAKIKKLRSFVSASLPEYGDQIFATVDLVTSPGHVELAHADPKVIEEDYSQIREWERQGLLYRLSPHCPRSVPDFPSLIRLHY